MSSHEKFLNRNKHIFFYSLLLAILVFLLKWIQWRFLIIDHSIEIYAGLLAVIFTALGVWIARHFSGQQSKKRGSDQNAMLSTALSESNFTNLQIEKYNLTQREFEILNLISKGLSNAEIAATSHLSLSTVKTHVSNILTKFDVKNRVQAINTAREHRLLG